MRKKKRSLKPIPVITQIEKQRALEVGRLIRQGIDPLTIAEKSIGTEFRYTVQDIAHYLELSKKPYTLVHSNFELLEEGDSYERKQKLS